MHALPLSIAPGRGPLLRAVDRADTVTRRRLERAWAAGSLVRLAPAVYCERDAWLERPAWERHTLAAAALTLAAPAPPVFAGLSAAHLHGLPVAETPAALTVRAARRGHPGRGTTTASLVSPRLLAWAREQDRIVAPAPTRAPRWGLPSSPDHPAHDVEALLADGTSLGFVRVDSLPTVQLTVASSLPWSESIPVLDGLQRREPAAGHRWALEADEALLTTATRRRFDAAWEFADGRSESAGESRMRVLIHELGFEAPTLQRSHVDRDARFIGRTDFWWDSPRVAGEFDGIGKYDIDLHADADARRQSLKREKTREVRLQRVTRRILHWTWEDFGDPAGVARGLREAGVPPRAAPSSGTAPASPRSAPARPARSTAGIAPSDDRVIA